jgi:multidrug efflux pump subunit AcrA (membrane-fusion protein)
MRVFRVGLWALLAACHPAEPAGEVHASTAGPWQDRLGWEEAVVASTMEVRVLPALVDVPPEARASLSPLLAGRLDTWSVQAGQQVEPGQTLAVLTSPSLQGMQESIRALRREEDALGQQLSAQEEAVALGLRSVDEVLSLRAERMRLQARREELERVDQGLRRTAGAGRQGATWSWTSPMRGEVLALHCPPGAEAGPAQPCLTLVDTSQVRLQVEVPEVVLARIGAPDALQVRFQTGGEPAWHGPFALQRMAPQVDATRRTRVLFFEAVGLTHPPGTTGRAELLVPWPAGAVAVPLVAVTTHRGERGVFVRQAEAGEVPAAFAPCREAGSTDGRRVVACEGVGPGDAVLARGVFLLRSRLLLAEE